MEMEIAIEEKEIEEKEIEEGYEMIRVDQEPQTNRWKLFPLYKMNEWGNYMISQVGFDGTHLCMIHGWVDGNKPPQIDKREIELRSKHTLSEQALVEARDHYRKMFRNKGYRPQSEQSPQDILLMRGQPWTQDIELAWPAGVMAKLDGVRGGMKLMGEQVRIRSSNNIEYHHLDHLREQLKPLFTFLPADAELDGEIYNHAYRLEEICSIVKSQKEKHSLNHTMNFYMFDLIYAENPIYEERYALLKRALRHYQEENPFGMRNVFLLPLYEVHNKIEITTWHRYFVSIGLEGTIIRCLGKGAKNDTNQLEKSKYRSGKCNHFYKLKDFQDAEAVVVGMEQGKGKYKGCALLRLKDPRGNIISVIHHGTLEEKRKAYEDYKRDPTKYVGRLYKYKFRELTEDKKIPRHSSGISWRDIDIPPVEK